MLIRSALMIRVHAGCTTWLEFTIDAGFQGVLTVAEFMPFATKSKKLDAFR